MDKFFYWQCVVLAGGVSLVLGLGVSMGVSCWAAIALGVEMLGLCAAVREIDRTIARHEGILYASRFCPARCEFGVSGDEGHGCLRFGVPLDEDGGLYLTLDQCDRGVADAEAAARAVLEVKT